MQDTTVSKDQIEPGASTGEALRLLGLGEDAGTGLVSAQIITDLEGIKAMREDWEKLYSTSTESLAHFQSYDWCMNWVKYCHDEARQELTIIPFWKKGELVALLPLMITTQKAGVRIMRFLGDPLIEYSNLLINRNKVKKNELVELWNGLQDRLHVDAFDVNNFPRNSCLFDIFGTDRISRSPSQSSSIMDLSRLESWESFRAGMSRSARRSRNKRRNKLTRLGEISYRVYEGGTQDYKNIVAQSVIMKQQWLEKTGRNVGDLFEENAITAIANMKGSVQEMDGAIAGALMLDDRIVATEVGFVHKGTYLSYIGAFDWDMRDYSVGKLQIEDALKWSLENGIKTYDFLGEPSVYKSDWSNGEVPLYCCHSGVSMRGWLYANFWKKQARPALKKIFHALPVSLRKKIMLASS